MGAAKVNICIPDLGYEPQSCLREALAQAMAAEVESASEDLANLSIERVEIRNATQLGEEGLEHLLSRMARTADLSRAQKVAFVAPETLSTAVMTALRNFHTGFYWIDLGSMDATEFRGLGRAYAMSVQGLVAQLVSAYRMNNFGVRLRYGIPGQTSQTARCSVERAVAFCAGAVMLEPFESANAADRGTSNNHASVRSSMASLLCEHGYLPAGKQDDGIYSLPEFAGIAGAVCETSIDEESKTGGVAEVWGFGPGSITRIDGFEARDEKDVRVYLRLMRAQGSAIACAKRMAS